MKTIGTSLLSGMWILAVVAGIYACDGANLAGGSNANRSAKKDESGGGCAANDSSCIKQCEKSGKTNCINLSGTDGNDTGTATNNSTNGPTANATQGGTAGSTANATAGGTAGSTANATAGGTAGSTANATAGGTAGGNPGATAGATLGGTTSAGDDGGLQPDGGEISTRLTENMTISQLKETNDDADDNFTVEIQKIDPASGNGGAMVSHEFKKHSAEDWVIPDFCKKTGDNGYMVKFVDRDTSNILSLSGDSKFVKQTGGSGNAPEITSDDGVCLFGNCVDRGKDNTFRFSCPHGTVLVQ